MTPHFSKEELTCKCGCGMLPDLNFMNDIERLRSTFARPLTVTSAARCPDYNATVSKTGRTGPHTTGRAIDFAVRGADAHFLLQIALIRSFTGIGVSQKGASRFIHLDNLPEDEGRPRPTVWSY